MNVLFLSEVTAANARNGAERTLREQVLGLNQRGQRVSRVTRAMAEDPRLTASVDVATEYRYPFSQRNEVAFVLSSVARSLRTLDGAAARHYFDAALSHQSFAGLGPIIFKRARARRWIYMCLSRAHEEYLSRNTQGKTPGERMQRLLNAYGRRWVERAVMRRCSRVIVMSDFMRKRVLAAHRIPEGKLYLLPGAVDHRKFHPATDLASIRRQLGLPTDRMVLCTVRNLGPRMGLENLLHALNEQGEELRDVLVLIGGEGPLRPMLEGLIRSLDLTGRVRLLGFIPEEYLPRYYQAADLMLLPTAELEGFGLVTVEALACGTPVLGTPVGATPEILVPLAPFLVFRDLAPETMAEDLRRFLEAERRDPEAHARLREACRRHVEAHYTWDRTIDALEDELTRLAARTVAPAGRRVACLACGAETRPSSLLYRGAPYRQCGRCRSSVVAAPPTALELQRYYQTEYPRRFSPALVNAERAHLFDSMLDRLSALGARPTPDALLLDVGCGGGYLLRAARGRGWRAVGTDLSWQACAVTHEGAGRGAVQADAARLPIRAGSLSVVTLVNVVDQAGEPNAILGEAHR